MSANNNNNRGIRRNKNLRRNPNQQQQQQQTQRKQNGIVYTGIPEQYFSANSKNSTQSNSLSSSKTQTVTPATEFPIGFDVIEKLCTDMDSKKIIVGSVDLLNAVQPGSFYRRMDNLWPDVKKQLKFLRVIVATASATQASILTMTHEFLTKVLKSNLIDTLIDSHIKVMKFDPSKCSPIHAKLVEQLIKLLTISLEKLPSQADRFLEKIEMIISILTSLDDVNFPIQEELDNLKIALKSRYEIKKAQFITEKKEKTFARNHSKFEGSRGEPPTNFREITIIPNKYEIIEEKTVFLRPAKKVGVYDSDEHYLDIQFRLLREDAIRPLRDGIMDYKKGGMKKTDLFVYQDVQLINTEMFKQTGDLMTNAQLKVRKNMKWNKRLKFGSLVCLSMDNFQKHLIFATVLDREMDKLAKGLVGLKFENNNEINLTVKYNMVESPAFFEAYRHVLIALQSLPPNETIPFSKYLVDVKIENELPLYLSPINSRDFNFLCLLKNPYARADSQCNVEDVLDKYQPADFQMDQSQLKALKYALTSSLAIIQGPPGTGKTFLGLQLTMLLFANEARWYNHDPKPILIVCYTNHALDQFLEGISTFIEDDIVRVGGRCKNPTLERFMLHNKRQYREAGNIRHQYNLAKDNCAKLQRMIQNLTDELDELNNDLVDTRILKQYLKNKPEYYNSIVNFDDLSLSNWLTYNIHQSIMQFDVIRVLVEWGIEENLAKAAQWACSEFDITDPDRIYEYIQKNNRNVLLMHYGEVRNWPKLADINRLINQGVPENIAIRLLMSSQDVQKVFANQDRINQAIRNSNSNTNNKKNEKVEEVIEEFDELLFKDFDEDNRKIEEFGIQVEKNTKNKQIDKWYKNSDVVLFKKYILNSPIMNKNTNSEIFEANNIYNISLHDRWRLYKLWISEAKNELQNQMVKIYGDYSTVVKKVTEMKTFFDLNILRHARVIGMTTTGAAMHQATLRTIQPRIVIVEEAAEILEGHLVTSLTAGCEHLILIGDHKQLRPNPSVFELAKEYNLEISLFERLINNNYPYIMLEKQHRMRPEISRNLMPIFYPDLKDDESVQNLPDVNGMQKNLFFFNHSHPEVADTEFKSHRNPFEAEFAVRLAIYLIQQGYKAEQITILCTYLEQLIALKKIANGRFPKDHNLRIDSVDNYQGEESDIIILSLVRSNNNENKIGFLSISNRVCVALSRAKIGLYVIANVDFLAKNSPNLWKTIRSRVEECGAIGNALPIRCQLHSTEQLIKSVEEFDALSPEGGCNIPCNYRLECGHSCMKPCHPEDIEHKKNQCRKACNRECQLGHPCRKKCFEDCGNCIIKTLKQLPCGHSKVDACYLPAEQVICPKPCQKLLTCGHTCQEKCNQLCTSKCQIIVTKKLSCGHENIMKCSTNISKYKCQKKVEKQWPICQHQVITACSTNVMETLCPKKCEQVLSECEHICRGSCGECRNGRIHIICNENCRRILICGHECKSKCSKICPPCEQMCETACGHSQCSQQTASGQNKKKIRPGLTNKRGKAKTRLCGDSCPRCAENCLNSCEHRQCELKCWMPCNVKPCMEPCQKLLPCSPKNLEDGEQPHMCMGVCGEECLKICEICQPKQFEEIREIFFGSEEDENARFIQLEDCKHYFEMSGIDTWVNEKINAEISSEDNQNADVAIVKIECPKCRTQIRRSKRYIAFLNKRALDIEAIKNTLRGGSKEKMANEWKKILEELIDFENSRQIYEKYALFSSFMNISNSLHRINQTTLTKNWFAIAKNIIRITNRLWQRFGEINLENFNNNIELKFINIKTILNSYRIDNLKKFLLEEIELILKPLLVNDIKFISEAVLQQIFYETDRLAFIQNLMKFISLSINDLNRENAALFKEILEKLFSDKEFTGKHEENLKNLFDTIKKNHQVNGFTITEEERLEIAKAVGMHVTKWYKCSKGHIYGIGECGLAMVKSKCPECNETIGGDSHRLISSSQAAPEMHVGVPPLPHHANPFVVYYH